MMRTESARSASARSSASPTIRLTLIPDAGSNSYIVMTGPGCTVTTLPPTPKSASFFSRIREFMIRLSRSYACAPRGGSWKIETSGRRNGPPAVFSANAKVSWRATGARSRAWSTISGSPRRTRRGRGGSGCDSTLAGAASGASPSRSPRAAATRARRARCSRQTLAERQPCARPEAIRFEVLRTWDGTATATCAAREHRAKNAPTPRPRTRPHTDRMLLVEAGEAMATPIATSIAFRTIAPQVPKIHDWSDASRPPSQPTSTSPAYRGSASPTSGGRAEIANTRHVTPNQNRDEMCGSPRPATRRSPSTPPAATANVAARPSVRSRPAASAAPSAPPALATACLVSTGSAGS